VETDADRKRDDAEHIEQLGNADQRGRKPEALVARKRNGARVLIQATVGYKLRWLPHRGTKQRYAFDCFSDCQFWNLK
jgi:hypothetical protein